MASEQSKQAEEKFFNNFAAGLSPHPVVYPNDYQQPLNDALKRVPVAPVDLPPPPEHETVEAAPPGSITITIKSTKPAQSYTMSVHVADTIAAIKSQLASRPGAPPADVQRLLLKGKAFADAKLLKEYDVKDGDTVNLMVKAGYNWDPSEPATAPPPPFSSSGSQDPVGPEHITLLPEPKTSRRGHTRIPSVVLSPSPSLIPAPDEKLADIPLIIDASGLPALTGVSLSPTADSSYRASIAQPEFWSRLYNFLTSEFPNGTDAAKAWEDFLYAIKGQLTVSEIAKIRDHVGVLGMAGT